MAKKEKEKPMLNLDGKEYDLDNMTDSEKELAGQVALYQNHVNDVQNKIATNNFMRQQLVECEKVFVEKHQKGLKELREVLKEK